MHIDELIRKSREGDVLSREELVYLLGLAPDSSETFMVMAGANRLSKELSGGKAEIMLNLRSILHRVIATVSSALSLKSTVSSA